jgi:environmental stress-induced protein Ves
VELRLLFNRDCSQVIAYGRIAEGAFIAADEEAVFHVRFEGLSPAEANLAAVDFCDLIEQSAHDRIQATIRKERDDTQDFGATVVLVLGTQTAVTLAKAIQAWIAKRGDRVVVETPQGKVVATGAAASNIDVAETTLAIQASAHER